MTNTFHEYVFRLAAANFGMMLLLKYRYVTEHQLFT